MMFIAAIAAATIGTTASAEQFQLGGQVHTVELATLCGLDGQTYAGHEIHVWPDGQLWIGERRREIEKFHDICPRIVVVTRNDNDGNNFIATATPTQQAAGQNGVANVPSTDPNGSFGGIGSNN